VLFCNFEIHLLHSEWVNFPSRPGPVNDQVKDRKEEEAEYDIRNLKVLWTACAFFHRFYVFHSFGSHDRFVSNPSCLKLSVFHSLIAPFSPPGRRRRLSVSGLQSRGETTQALGPCVHVLPGA
jgi:hypothetical protein